MEKRFAASSTDVSFSTGKVRPANAPSRGTNSSRTRSSEE